MKDMIRKHIWELILIAVLIPNIIYGNEIKADILQYKMGRFTFSQGTEFDIYENCFFEIFNDNSLIFTGQIEKSYPGLSFSYPDRVIYDTLKYDSIVINSAEIDSVSTINVGILKDNEPSDFISSPIPKMTIIGNPIDIKKYDSFFEMSLALENGDIDLIASYKNYNSQTEKFNQYSKPADYFSAMIPNVESNLNIKGTLTNSLYYRYSPDLFAIYYDGDKIAPYNRLIPDNDTADRFIPYDPAKGKNLLRTLRNFDNLIDIAPADSSLKRLSAYFEDMLARDKIKIEPGNGDIILANIPIDFDNRGASLDSIFNIMLRAAPLNGDVEENLALIENYIDNGHSADDPVKREYYFSIAEQNLIEQFGVFPLYRPYIFFTFSRQLKNLINEENQTIDIGRLKLINIPERESIQ